MQSSRCQHDTSTHAKFCLEFGTPVAGGSGRHSVMFDLSAAFKGAMLKNFDAVKGPSGVEIASLGA